MPGRILMTADAVGGVWSYALDLAAGLAERGIGTVLAVMGPAPSDRQRADAARIPGLTVEARDYALEWMPDGERDLDAAGTWLLDLERTCRPDVVHLNGYAAAALPWRAPRLVVAHSCVETWWRAVHGEAAPAEWERYRRRVRDGLHAADLVVTPTAAFLQALRMVYGNLGETRVIRNGRAVPAHEQGEKDPIVLAAGRAWDIAKDVAALDAAAAELAWPVCLAGDRQGPDGSMVSLPNLTCLGRLEAAELMRRMARAAVFVSPARYEPFGLAVLEAASQGCALVLSDIPAFRELWDGAAAFAPPGRPDALAAVLAGVIGDADRRLELGAAARRRAAAYTVEAMTDGYCAAYLELITRRRSAEARRPFAASA